MSIFSHRGDLVSVGNNVVRLLLSHQRAVRVLLRIDRSARALAGLDVAERVAGDVTDADSLRRACQNVKQAGRSLRGPRASRLERKSNAFIRP